MANKHLSLKPMNIDENNWYYEDAGGIDLVHIEEFPVMHGGIEKTAKKIKHIKISWRKLRASLNRKDKK